MMGMATTTISILRGTSTDAFGDEIDSATVIATIPASIIEQSRVSWSPADGVRREVRTTTGRVAHDTDIRPEDRVRDDRTGVLYAVVNTDQAQNPAMALDLRLNLMRVT
jgi:hypothetical protein